MAFQLGAIVAPLKLDSSGFLQGMLQANSVARMFPRVVQDFMANPLLGLQSIIHSTMSSLKGIVSGFISNSDQIARMAENLGLSAQSFDTLRLAAQRFDLSTEDIAQTLMFLQKAMAGAMSDPAAAQAFKDLGIGLDEVQALGNDAVEMFIRVAGGLKGLESAAQRTDLAMTLFGRGGGRLVEFANIGEPAMRAMMRQVQASGAVMTTEAAKIADGFNESQWQLSLAWTKIKNALAEPIANALLPILNELTAWVQEHPGEIAQIVSDMAKSVVAAMQAMASAAKSLLENFRLVSIAAGAWAGMKTGAGIGAYGGPKGVAIGGAVGALAGGIGAFFATKPSAPAEQSIDVTVNAQLETADQMAQRVGREVTRQIKRAQQQPRLDGYLDQQW
jgi:hypothetical protein